MSEKMRRVRLLVVVGVLGLAAVGAAWPSQGEATEMRPLYLARDKALESSGPAPNSFLAVGDAATLAAHLVADGEYVSDLEVIDSAGQVVELRANGEVHPTGVVVEPAAVKSFLAESFRVRSRALEVRARDNGTAVCHNALGAARSRLDLPTSTGGRELTLTELYAEADPRIAAMHQPGSQIPAWCLTREPNHDHDAGYLHNLWHRITGS